MNSDLISREAVKKQLNAKIDLDQDDEFNRGYNIGISACVEVIDNAPTVKFSLMPADESKDEAYMRGYKHGMMEGLLKERPQGEWIDYSNEGYVECPFCHEATNCDDNKEELHFCWNCGAAMGGEKNGNQN